MNWHPEKDFARRTGGGEVELGFGPTPAHAGSPLRRWRQKGNQIRRAATGKFFCLEGLNAQDGKPYAGVPGKMDLLDPKQQCHQSQRLDHRHVVARSGQGGMARRKSDRRPDGAFGTRKKNIHRPISTFIVIWQYEKLAGFRYVQRQGDGGGRIKDYGLYGGRVVTAIVALSGVA